MDTRIEELEFKLYETIITYQFNRLMAEKMFGVPYEPYKYQEPSQDEIDKSFKEIMGN